LVSSLLSLIVGTVLGLTQIRIKRLFAYSTISHVGFIFLASSFFFDKPEYKISDEIKNINLDGNIIQNNVLVKKVTFKVDSIRLSSPLTNTISVLSLTILLFMFIPQEWLSMANILAL